MRKISYSPDTIVKVPNIFGDGSDGNKTYSSNTTLTADINAENIVINSGVVVTTAGYRLLARNSFTNSGTVRNNGANAVGASGGASGAGITVQFGQNGGPGRTTIAAGGIGEGPINTPSTLYFAAGGGGTAGAQSGGSPTAQTLIEQGLDYFRNIQSIYFQSVIRNNVVATIGAGGGGGGGGNATGAAVTSGGGGGGGGTVLVAAKILDNTNGIIQSLGGNGAAASGVGNGGGGGGGGGGLIILIGLTISNGTLTVTGGTGGGGIGTGAAGGNGGVGLTISVPGA